MPVLILLRGAPGSGKSTAASKLWGFAHYETDQYFMHDGYEPHPEEIELAHPTRPNWYLTGA